MNSRVRVGIDVGSTTIKVVVLDKEKQIVYKKYARHFSEINTVLKENLSALTHVIEDKVFSLALTGSAGMGIAERIGLPFVQEVIACATAVKSMIPSTDTVVELGGEAVLEKLALGNPVLSCMVTALVGLIPNCAVSVAITELYLNGALSLSAMLSGLLTGSGVGMLVLFRTNRHGKENFMILGIVYVCGVLGGLTAGLLF